MGERLVRIYRAVQQVGGLSGKTRLAIETKIPSTKAALAPDSEENVKLFKEAFAKVTGQQPPEV